MKSSNKIWITVSTVSIIVTCILIYGFIIAVQDIVNPSGNTDFISEQKETTTTSPIEQSTEIKIAAIGDSLAKGTGDDEGKGFVRRVVSMLKEDGKEVRVTANLAINGLTAEKLLPELDEAGVKYTLEQSNLILLSIGANDLFQGAQAGQAADINIPDTAALFELLTKASDSLENVLKKIAEINPNAKIVYVGLYNPFNDLKDLKQVGNAVVTTWNSKVLELISTYDQMALAPTFDLFENNVPQLLASDHFHPNAQGYEEMAERIVEVLGITDRHGKKVEMGDE
ncbi:GDSL-type esterase/lipase family protein [Paenibacillus polygoni]|uniref:GDSL-type esterase/lipase family protein n=1 Tax=Paenibacillus polygoni TaxID=3050112 RepID=A0ABY8WXQ3_9BACL|nr:GDSL-type esterase/lipase family protein [Paenibacillus polygoni]WIV17886.1 GDSL-type esterase/lipase family protein [Paenibacillus polygoni]